MLSRRTLPLIGMLLLATVPAVAIAGNIPLTNWTPAPYSPSTAASSGPRLNIGTNASAAAFMPITPCRVYDSRFFSPGTMLVAGTTRLLKIHDATYPAGFAPCTAMPSGTLAYSMNITTFGSPSNGSYAFVTLWPVGTSQPTVSSMNFLSGTQTSNAVVVATGTSADINIYTTATTHFVLDINGYYTASHDGANGFVSYSPSGVGVQGNSTANVGVLGSSSSSIGVYGHSGDYFGVVALSDHGDALYASSSGTSGIRRGVYGDSHSAASRSTGVMGVDYTGEPTYPTDATFGIPTSGVMGVSASNVGVLGMSRWGGDAAGDFIRIDSVSPYGVVARARLAYSAGSAAYFDGSVHVQGTLSKSAGSFKIDHPLDPDNKYLYHSFVESPDMMNVYNGIAVLDGSGQAVVQLPTYFEALNVEPRYQLTAIGKFAPVYVADEIANNQFRIAGGQPGMKVSWQVTGIRDDAFARAHRIQVEVDKEAENRGKYLSAVELGKPASLAIGIATPSDQQQAEDREASQHKQK